MQELLQYEVELVTGAGPYHIGPDGAPVDSMGRPVWITINDMERINDIYDQMSF